ncbi:MAG: protein-export chaperone SecB [Acidimicrobiia bacterium]|nr:protein-export chaperone SecB [Acidimicrobiia bacterium]
MTDEVELAGQVGALANLLQIKLLRSTSELQAGYEPGQLAADVDASYDWALMDDARLLVCEIGCEVHIRRGAEAVFDCSAIYGAVYALPEDVQLSDEAYGAFAATSATFSVHPYLREFIQSLTTRAGLPPLSLATLR